MRLHRLIFRLDFQGPSFEIIDAPGKVMKLLSEMGQEKQYWPEFQDSVNSRIITVQAVDEKDWVFRQFSSEPTEMNFVFESARGLTLDSFESDMTLTTLFRGINALCDEFKIEKFARAGLRMFVLGTVPTDDADKTLLAKFESFFDKNLIESIGSRLGRIRDLALVLEGDEADRLHYRFWAGPYSSSEAKKYFASQTIKGMDELGVSANFISDIDFSELNFAMTVRPLQWCRGPIAKAKKILEDIENILAKAN